jgi:hypothetical protein
MNPKPLSVLSVRIVPVKFVCLPCHCPRDRAQDPAAFRPGDRLSAGSDWRSRCPYFKAATNARTPANALAPENQGVWALVGYLVAKLMSDRSADFIPCGDRRDLVRLHFTKRHRRFRRHPLRPESLLCEPHVENLAALLVPHDDDVGIVPMRVERIGACGQDDAVSPT